MTTMNEEKMWSQGVLNQKDYALNVQLGRDENVQSNFHSVHQKHIDVYNQPGQTNTMHKLAGPKIDREKQKYNLKTKNIKN